MNGKQSRKLRLKSKELVMEWVRSLLNEEEAEKISLENTPYRKSSLHSRASL